MRLIVRGLLAFSFCLGAVQTVYAGCGDNPGDDAAVLAARQQVEADCDCAGSTNHGEFVSCAAAVANARASADPPLLPKNCKGAVKRCAAKSTCGKPGFVTCCITNAHGTKCKTNKDAQRCLDKQGVVGSCSSCCDACPQPGTGPSCSPSGAFLD